MFMGGVPVGLVVLHPLIEGWACRSMLLAGGSTRPRRHCNLAVLRAERLGPQQLLEPEMPLDLEFQTKNKVSTDGTSGLASERQNRC